MKKFSSLLCCLALCLAVFSGCSADSASQKLDNNYLRPIQLTEREEELVRLIADTSSILMEYQVEGARSLSIDTFIRKDGSWVKEKENGAIGHDDAETPMSGRLALTYTSQAGQFGITKISIDSDGALMTSSPLPLETDLELRSATNRSQNEFPVILDEPIALLTFGVDPAEAESTSSVPVDPFAHPELLSSQSVWVVAVTFSSQPL